MYDTNGGLRPMSLRNSIGAGSTVPRDLPRLAISRAAIDARSQLWQLVRILFAERHSMARLRWDCGRTRSSFIRRGEIPWLR